VSTTARLEKQVLFRALVEPAFRAKARGPLEKGGCFGDPALAWVWRTALTLPADEPISRTALMALVELAWREQPEKEELHVTMVDQVFEQAGANLASMASVEALNQLVAHARLEKAVVEAGTLLDKGDVEGAQKCIAAIQKQGLGQGRVRRVDYAESVPERLAAMRAQDGPSYTYIPTGIPGIDKYIDGVRLSELLLIVATTGMGKSIMAMCLAAASAMPDPRRARHPDGFVTAVFATEMLIEQVAMRFDAHFAGLEHRKFKTWGFSSEEEDRLAETFAVKMEQLRGKLFLFDTPIRECKLEVVEHAVMDLEDELGVAVENVVLDSPGQFKPERKYEQKRLEAADVFWDIKAMARGEGLVKHVMAVEATDQAAKEYERKMAGSSATSESYDKARICDLMITMNQDGVQEINGEMILNLAKARDSQSRAQVKVRTMYNVMRFEEIGEVLRSDLVSDETRGR
jgi:hypothetical protein